MSMKLTNKEAIYTLTELKIDLVIKANRPTSDKSLFETVDVLQHAIEVLKRFEGAVEVDDVREETEYEDENGNEFQYPQEYFEYFKKIPSDDRFDKFKPIGTSKTYKLFAIPKEQE